MPPKKQQDQKQTSKTWRQRATRAERTRVERARQREIADAIQNLWRMLPWSTDSMKPPSRQSILRAAADYIEILNSVLDNDGVEKESKSSDKVD